MNGIDEKVSDLKSVIDRFADVCLALLAENASLHKELANERKTHDETIKKLTDENENKDADIDELHQKLSDSKASKQQLEDENRKLQKKNQSQKKMIINRYALI